MCPLFGGVVSLYVHIGADEAAESATGAALSGARPEAVSSAAAVPRRATAVQDADCGG